MEVHGEIQKQNEEIKRQQEIIELKNNEIRKLRDENMTLESHKLSRNQQDKSM